jgi:HEAT repeat protein
MRRRGKVFIFIAVGVVVASVLVAWGMREPRYQGRTLTSLLEQSPGKEESDSAIRAIGAEKALPYLLSMIQARDGRLRLWMVAHNENWKPHFRFKSAEDIQVLGVTGFYVLGTNAAAAVPELTRMLDDTNHAFIAVQCLFCIGEPARKSLCQALTNSDWQVRRDSTRCLARTLKDTKVYMAQMNGCLNDSNSAVRLAAVWGIGAQTNNPDLAIPMLVAALNDKDENVSAKAAQMLGGFGTNSLRAVGVLTNLVQSGNPITESAAVLTLIKIAPRETLPMVLKRLHSDDVKTRLQSLILLYQYPLKAPEIQTAIEEAAEDPDSEVSLAAKGFISEQQREQQRKTH